MSSTIIRGGHISSLSTGIINILLTIKQCQLSYLSDESFMKRNII